MPKQEKPVQKPKAESKPQKQVEFNINELPAEVQSKFNKYTEAQGIHKEEALTIAREEKLAELYEATIALHNNPKGVAVIVSTEIAREMKDKDIICSPKDLAELVKLIDAQTISVKIAKEVLSANLKGEGSPAEIVEKRGLKQINSVAELEPVIDKIITANPKNVDLYKSGKTQLFGFFVGQVLKETQGRANPELVSELLKKKLST